MENHNQSRRQWLTGLLRWSVLSIIAAGTALLVRRSGGGARGPCALQLPCERCGSRAGCQLPQAVAWRGR
jgi:hypothetical protein